MKGLSWVVPVIAVVVLALGLFFPLGGKAKSVKDISDRTLPESIEIDYSWVGLAPYTIRQSFHLKLLPDHKAYRSNGELMNIPPYSPPNHNLQVTRYTVDVPVGQVQGLLKTMREEPWKPAQRPAEVIEHTDDYPNLSVTFTQGKDTTYKLASTSNTANGSPWNLYMDKQLYSSNGGQIGNQIHSLIERVRPSAKQEKAGSN